MELTDNQKLILGIGLTIVGTLVMVYYWGTGNNIKSGGDYWIPSCFAQITGPILILEGIGFKSKEIKMAGPAYMILIGLILNLYTYQYLKPKILSEGAITRATVTKTFMDDDTRVSQFVYEVNDVKYCKSAEIGDKSVGQNIKVAYLTWRPDYHLVVNTRKKSK